MSRATRHGVLFFMAVVAVVGALWLANDDRPFSTGASTPDTMAIAQRPHGVATIALRAPAPCTRSELPRHELAGRQRDVAPPVAPSSAAIPLYARLRVYRL